MFVLAFFKIFLPGILRIFIATVLNAIKLKNIYLPSPRENRRFGKPSKNLVEALIGGEVISEIFSLMESSHLITLHPTRLFVEMGLLDAYLFLHTFFNLFPILKTSKK